MVYYNEFDPFAAAWLRELIAAGELPAGDVDERSIEEVKADELRGYSQCHFFAGIGGWPLALRWAGVAPDEPLFSGSCPCQPFSDAGLGLGEKDPRHLWPHLRRLIANCRPPIVFGEQVASKAGRVWLAGVRADLEALDYAVPGSDLCAAGVGAPDIRQRLWWMAYANGRGLRSRDRNDGYQVGSRGGRFGSAINGGGDCGLADSDCERLPRRPEQDGGTLGPEQQAPRRDHVGGCGDDVRLGDSNSEREDSIRGVPGGAGAQCTGGPDGLGNTESVGHGEEPERRGDRESEAAGREYVARGSGAWAEYDLIHCRDGKARRIEPGSFPLAYGIPRRLGQSESPLAGLARPASRNRVGRLRGYGNAIVPQLAAEFIQACFESVRSVP